MSEDVYRRDFLAGAGTLGAAMAVPKSVRQLGAVAESLLSDTVHVADTAAENPFNKSVIGFAMSDTLFDRPGTTNEQMSETEIEHWLGTAKKIGATAIRVDFDGNLFQPSDEIGDYDWSYSDRIIKAAKKFKLEVMATVTYTPPADQLAKCKGAWTCPPSNLQDFADFAGAIAERYKKDDLRKFEIWNEPNIQIDGADPVRYARMFNLSRLAIKKANKDAVVSLGALAGVATSGNRIGPAEFIDQAIKAGARGFDAVSFNAYSHPNLPDQPAWWNPFDQIEGPVEDPPAGTPKPPTVLSVLKKHGLEHLPILITEFGAPSNEDGADFQTDSVMEVIGHRFREANVPGRYVYTLMNRDGNSGYDQYGLVKLNGEFKPAAKAMRRYLRTHRLVY